MSSGISVRADPYVGPRPFEAGDRHLFFGREREAYEISSLVVANRFFMLYAASGAGKTSLVNAGVLPLVGDELEVLPTARFQASYPDMAADISNVYTHAVLSSWSEPDALSQLTQATLTEYLASRSQRIGPGDLPMPRLLVFDQFEELFTTQPQRWQDRRKFLEQLSDASRSHADLRILVVIREDFLSHLLDYADAFYGGMKDRYFLEPLRRPAAELAIQSPAMSSGRSFEPDAADDLVRQLMANRVDLGDSRIVHIQGEFVEPLLLQVACRALWTALPPTVSRITLAHVRELADVDTVLARFYSDAVREAAAHRDTVTERQIREWVQRNLITPEGTRGIVHIGASTTAGLPNDVVSSLEGKFLRAEFRAGARWLEITHDSMLGPIEQSNREYFSSQDKSSPSHTADLLATMVKAQWETEARLRRLNDPYPLPVGWSAADPALTDQWELLTRLANSGAAWRASRSSRLWGTGPDDLAGHGGELVGVLNRVPTRRLVVLGAPGSGKTTLMIRLVLDLLSIRAQHDPVPVLIPAAGWDPARQPLHAWLSAYLITTYPALAAPAGRGPGAGTLIQSLLEARRILPILDGLDEIPSALRGLAIRRVNEALSPDDPLVVTSRTQEFAETVQATGDDPLRLRAAAAIQLRPLDARDVGYYLQDSAAGPAAAARWDPVLNILGTQAPAAQALTRPLMVGLANIIYNPHPGEQAGDLRDPAELYSSALPDRAAVENFLFDGFIPALYRIHSRWSAQDAGRSLTFLAAHLENTIGSPDLAWWQLAKAIRGRALGLAVGVVLGLILGAVGGLVLGPQWLGYGMAAGLVPGLAIGLGLSSDRPPSYRAIWRPIRSVRAGVPPSPQAALMRDRRAGFAIGLVAVVVIGVPVGLTTGIARGPIVGITLGIVSGFAIGLAAISKESAWPRWQLARCWLWATRRLPWMLMAFLQDAHYRGVLRQAGPVYQFRHIELQHRLTSCSPLDAHRKQ